jgi:prophage maintenance system killer protein
MDNKQIEIFKSEDGSTEIEVRVDNETVWLNQYQISDLFLTDRTSIGRHISNIYKTKELEENSTSAKIAQVRKEGKRTVTRQIGLYNLDVILSVGYRVNSDRGRQFRIWTNRILSEYLLKGYALNERKLKEQNGQLNKLKQSVKILGEVLNYKTLTNDESIGLLKIISDYAYAFNILDQYDYQSLEIKDTSEKEIYQLTYEKAMTQIRIAKKAHGNSGLFGHEKDDSFRSSVSTIYQTFGGQDLYPSIEEKAANLLYFITKNHSFSDGNKRIAAFLFLYFLERNGILFDQNGNKRIADNTLVALTLMIAVSKPDEKDTMTKVVVNLINRNN